MSESLLYSQRRQFATSSQISFFFCNIPVTFYIKRLHTLVPVKWQPYDDELLSGTIREPLLF